MTPPNAVSDTPRTDAAQFEQEHATMPGYALAGWALARQLERELQSLRKAMEGVEKGTHVIVPREPTLTMLEAYRAMLEASRE